MGDSYFCNICVTPKDKDNIQQNVIIHQHRNNMLEHDEKCTGKSVIPFGERLMGHLKASSPIYDHQSQTGNNT